MGGVVAKGQNNDELIDHLVEAKYIQNERVEDAFRAVDRGDFFPGDYIEDAYKDNAMRCDRVHISAPCIYCEVLENFNLTEGLSFLNIGSGTGYLSTLVGLFLGPYGTNHGIELFPDVIDYSNKKVEEFIRFSDGFNPITFCRPIFVLGNVEQFDMDYRKYDRIYCGATVVNENMRQSLKDLLSIRGILIYPYGENLVKCQRMEPDRWEEIPLLHVQFSELLTGDVSDESVIRINSEPRRLQDLSRFAVLKCIGKKNLNQVDSLPISRTLIRYLNYYRDPKCVKPRTLKSRHQMEDVPWGVLAEPGVAP